MREPYALKGARTVPGRGEGGNTLSLFDRCGEDSHVEEEDPLAPVVVGAPSERDEEDRDREEV